MIRSWFIYGVLFLFFLLYILAPYGKQTIHAQTGVTPTLFCLSGEPCGPSDNPNPMTPLPTQTSLDASPGSTVINPQTAGQTTGQAPAPMVSSTTTNAQTQQPCLTNTTVRYSFHRHHGGLLSIGGNILIKLFLAFLLLLLQLFVGNPGIITNPSTAVGGAPTSGILPSASPAAPCPPAGNTAQAPANTPSGSASPAVSPSSGNSTTGASPSASGSASSTNCTQTISPGTSISSTEQGMQPGGVLCVKGGSYSEDVKLSTSGSDGNFITVRNADNETPTITSVDISGNFITFTGFEVTGGGDPLVMIEQGAHDINVQKNNIHDGQGNGVRNYGNNILFEDNDLSHFANEDAIRLWGDHHTYRRNHIHDVANSGHNDPFQTWIHSDGALPPLTNLVLDSNVVENFSGGNAHCFMAENQSQNAQSNWDIKNNTFQNIGSHCFILGKPGEIGIQNVTFENNTFNNIGGDTIECQGGTTASGTGNNLNGGKIVNNSGNCNIN